MNGTALFDIYRAAIGAVDPYTAVRKAMRIEGGTLHTAGGTFDLGVFRRILVLGAGKATARMALATEDLLGDRISEGCAWLQTIASLPGIIWPTTIHIRRLRSSMPSADLVLF